VVYKHTNFSTKSRSGTTTDHLSVLKHDGHGTGMLPEVFGHGDTTGLPGVSDPNSPTAGTTESRNNGGSGPVGQIGTMVVSEQDVFVPESNDGCFASRSPCSHSNGSTGMIPRILEKSAVTVESSVINNNAVGMSGSLEHGVLRGEPGVKRAGGGSTSRPVSNPEASEPIVLADKSHDEENIARNSPELEETSLTSKNNDGTSSPVESDLDDSQSNESEWTDDETQHPRTPFVPDPYNPVLTRETRSNKLAELDKAIRVNRKALRRASRTNRIGAIMKLGAALEERFELTGLLKDLDEAIALYRTAFRPDPRQGHA